MTANLPDGLQKRLHIARWKPGRPKGRDLAAMRCAPRMKAGPPPKYLQPKGGTWAPAWRAPRQDLSTVELRRR
eukprot:11224488-Lingulodinium_polyedra.AAC.1